LFGPGRNQAKVNTTGAWQKDFKASNITHTQRVRRAAKRVREIERDREREMEGKAKEIEPVEASLPAELLPDKRTRTMDCSSHKSCTSPADYMCKLRQWAKETGAGA